jgi:hypothetical protein
LGAPRSGCDASVLDGTIPVGGGLALHGGRNLLAVVLHDEALEDLPGDRLVLVVELTDGLESELDTSNNWCD